MSHNVILLSYAPAAKQGNEVTKQSDIQVELKENHAHLRLASDDSLSMLKRTLPARLLIGCQGYQVICRFGVNATPVLLLLKLN